MKQITKIVIGKTIKIYHSDEVLDKKEDYHITFNSVCDGYKDYYVPKESVSKNIPLRNQLEIVLYVPSKKFFEDKDYWIDTGKEHYRKIFGKYKWYLEPKVI